MRIEVALASMGVALAASAAHAGPLPDAYAARADVRGGSGVIPIGQGISGTDVSGSSAPSLSVSVSAHNSSGVAAPYGGGGYLDLFYYYRVKPPAGVAAGTIVPVTLTGTIDASSTGATGEAIGYINYDANGEASNLGPGITIGFGSAPAGPGVIYAGEYFGANTGGPQTRSVTYDVAADADEEIALYAFADAGGPGDNGSSTGGVTVDPFIVLSPTLERQGYSLQFSSNIIGAGGAVPEPTTWAMMLIGCLGLGAVLRRSRRGWACRTA